MEFLIRLSCFKGKFFTSLNSGIKINSPLQLNLLPWYLQVISLDLQGLSIKIFPL